MTPVTLDQMSRCFYGVAPSLLATTDDRGVPNVTFVSQIHYLDERHVALSRQFFNKTSRNLDTTRKAFAELYDPVTLQAYRLTLRFLRSETEGPLFDAMSRRIDAIASHTGMSGVFRLIGADVFEVEQSVKVEGFLAGEIPPVGSDDVALQGTRSEIRGLQTVSNRINTSRTLDELLNGVLESLEDAFDFRHSKLLLCRDGKRLITAATRGYDGAGIGSEVIVGEGLIGVAARQRKPFRITALAEGLRYGRAARRQSEESGMIAAPEVPLPGLDSAQCVLVIPLWMNDDLLGALVVESDSPTAFCEWHEAYLELIGNQIALSIAATAGKSGDLDATAGHAAPVHPSVRRRLDYYAESETLFVDGDYLVRNVPAKILWKMLQEWRASGRIDYTNRELRLDASLGLPEVKDNLESRLLLLRRRLEEKEAGVRLVPTGRGRFALQIAADLELHER